MDTARSHVRARSLAGRRRLADRPVGWPSPRAGSRASRQSGSNKKQGSCWPLLLLSNLLQRSKFLSKLVPKPKFETEQKLNDEAPFKVQQTWKKRVGKCWCIRIKIYGALAFAQPPIAWVCTTVNTVSLFLFLPLLLILCHFGSNRVAKHIAYQNGSDVTSLNNSMTPQIMPYEQGTPYVLKRSNLITILK